MTTKRTFNLCQMPDEYLRRNGRQSSDIPSERRRNLATSKEFHDYVLEQLSGIGEFSSRKIMGEYCDYDRGKLIGDFCDNTLLLKPTESVRRLMPDA